jgi:hypothetical protein
MQSTPEIPYDDLLEQYIAQAQAENWTYKAAARHLENVQNPDSLKDIFLAIVMPGRYQNRVRDAIAAVDDAQIEVGREANRKLCAHLDALRAKQFPLAAEGFAFRARYRGRDYGVE